eukprot:scaffold388_cov244-Pinguiococcus_pyrenoidosus.AAC.24
MKSRCEADAARTAPFKTAFDWQIVLRTFAMMRRTFAMQPSRLPPLVELLPLHPIARMRGLSRRLRAR